MTSFFSLLSVLAAGVYYFWTREKYDHEYNYERQPETSLRANLNLNSNVEMIQMCQSVSKL
jgi:hypothetical protein